MDEETDKDPLDDVDLHVLRAIFRGRRTATAPYDVILPRDQRGATHVLTRLLKQHGPSKPPAHLSRVAGVLPADLQHFSEGVTRNSTVAMLKRALSVFDIQSISTLKKAELSRL